VLDLTTYAAGAICSMTLADWGAEVIKVESLEGDPFRTFGHSMGCPMEENDNIQFELVNRNKRGISLDLKTEKGERIFHKLLATADVFVTNYRPGAIKRLKLNYEALAVQYPRLIYAYVNGYGDEGPDKDKPGFDTAAYWARGGILAEFGEAGSDPIPTVPGFGDNPAGTFLAGGVCAALIGREKTGKGCFVQTALYNAAIWNLSLCIAGANNRGEWVKATRKDPIHALRNSYKTKDGRWIYVAVLEYERYWPPFCRIVLERPDLVNDPRFKDYASSCENNRELAIILEETFSRKSAPELMEGLKAADIVFEILKKWHEIKEDVQAIENGFIIRHPMPSGRMDWVPGNPIKFNREKTTLKKHAPKLGEDNEGILLELGYSKGEIATFKKDRIIR
jgi:crotonobetainyl-CoA:carnitine CoA-transferase CaiB-like acyl-CoA transferase